MLVLSSPTLWKRNRIIALEKTNYKCSKCGEPTKIVHHIDGKKVDHREENLTPLCYDCHSHVHHEMGSIGIPANFIPNYSPRKSTGIQVALNSKVPVEVAQALKQASKDLERSQASIITEALMDWFNKMGIPRMGDKLTDWSNEKKA